MSFYGKVWKVFLLPTVLITNNLFLSFYFSDVFSLLEGALSLLRLVCSLKDRQLVMPCIMQCLPNKITKSKLTGNRYKDNGK